MENTEKEQTLSNIVSTQSLPDYEAVDVLWTVLTKAANSMKGASECVPDRERIILLVEKFSDEEIKRLLKDKSVDSLIFLDPPLETVLAHPEEKPGENSTVRIIAKARSSRNSDPGEALINLIEILKRIHNKHFHEFKTVTGPQDKEILLSTRKILYLLCMLTISKLN